MVTDLGVRHLWNITLGSMTCDKYQISTRIDLNCTVLSGMIFLAHIVSLLIYTPLLHVLSVSFFQLHIIAYAVRL
jgi:hypothetical protein